MNHASSAIAPPDSEVIQVGDAIWERTKGSGLVQGAVRPVHVVEVLVLAQHDHQMPLIHTGTLWSTGFDSHGDWARGMAAGTSPAIIEMPGTSYEIAYADAAANLNATGPDSADPSRYFGFGMMPGTSPSIAPQS